jgi:hypothetical protein
MDQTVSLIFVTNMAKYALKGYEVDALDFMVKPVEYFNFSLKMDKAIRLRKRYAASSVLLETADGVVKVEVSKIKYIESDKHFVIYHTETGAYRVRTTMNDTHARFAGKGFARCGISYLVNLSHVNTVSGFTVTVGKDGAHLLLFKTRFKKRLLGVLQMLLGVLLVVVVVQIPDGHIVIFILVKILGKAAHSRHYVFGVQKEMLFGGCGGKKHSCLFKCKHIVSPLFSFSIL